MSDPSARPRLAFPDVTAPVVRRTDRGEQVLDRVRRRFVRLTPEEWVRQHLLAALIEALDYPIGLLAVEPTIRTPAGTRRPDVVAYDRARTPLLIAECKAPSVAVTQEVVDQVGRYNVVTAAGHLLVTNGLQHVCWRIDRDRRTNTFLDGIPTFNELR